MNSSEIARWNRKVKFLEMTENVIGPTEQSEHQPVSFYEGVALFLSEAFLKPESEEDKPSSGYLSQRAA